MPLVEIKELVKHYPLGDTTVQVLHGVSASFEKGSFSSIMGPSGSGKSTFLNILGCLDIPTQGYYLLDGQDVSVLTAGKVALSGSASTPFAPMAYPIIFRCE